MPSYAAPAYMPPLDHAVWSTFHSRPWAMTGRQYAALVRLSAADDWLRLTQRELAAHLGYSLKGAHGLIVSMRAGGLLAVRTRRGRHGGTWIRAQAGLLAALARNVSQRRTGYATRGNYGGNISSDAVDDRPNVTPAAADPPSSTWAALGPRLAALARRGR